MLKAKHFKTKIVLILLLPGYVGRKSTVKNFVTFTQTQVQNVYKNSMSKALRRLWGRNERPVNEHRVLDGSNVGGSCENTC